jgi:hypothetical protein
MADEIKKRIRVIFYRAKWGDKHWLDNAISIWTGLISSKNRKVGPYSHVEIWTPSTSSDFINEGCDGRDYLGMSFTSTMRGKDNGTVSRPAYTVINNPARWDYADIELSDEQYQRVLLWMVFQVTTNTGYSKRDLLKFFGIGFFADKTKNICSEFCNNAIQQAWGLDDDEVVSPRRLAWKLQKAGYQIRSLSRPDQQDIDNIMNETNWKE